MMTLLAATLFWGCSDDDESTTEANASISLSTEVLQAEKKGGEVSVTVTSSADWRLAGVCDWAHPSATSGKNGDVVTFTVDPNEENVYRSFTFKFFTGSQVAPLKVESQTGYMMKLISEESVSMSRDKGVLTVKLNTNIEEPVIAFTEGGEQWVTFLKRAEFGGKVSMQFEVAANATYKNRSTKITLSSPLVDNTVTVDLLQKQTDAINVDNKSLVFDDLSARTISFELKYNVPYGISVPKGSSWITNQKISEPIVGEDGLSTVTVSYDLKEGTVTRGGTIDINQENGPISQTIVVTQKDANAKEINFPDAVFRQLCIDKGWVMPAGATTCIVVEDGVKATSFVNTEYWKRISDLTGIESFPNLETIDLANVDDMTKLDISGLHKVRSLTFSSNRKIEVYNLGDNPVANFVLSRYSLDCPHIKIISSVIDNLNLGMEVWYEDYDGVESIDVSECPALKTLNVSRGPKLKTLYLKTGQVIPNLTKKEHTQIVYK